MICTRCYHRRICRRQLDGDGRCRYYLKKGKVRLDKDFEMDVNPMDIGEADMRGIQKAASQ